MKVNLTPPSQDAAFIQFIDLSLNAFFKKVFLRLSFLCLSIGLSQQIITWYMVVGKFITIPALGHQSKGKSSFTGSGACFSKVPKLFG